MGAEYNSFFNWSNHLVDILMFVFCTEGKELFLFVMFGFTFYLLI